jgi:hypothetical protein
VNVIIAVIFIINMIIILILNGYIKMFYIEIAADTKLWEIKWYKALGK